MSNQLNVTSEITVTIKMDATYADKLTRSLARALGAIGRLDLSAQGQLVNMGTVDDLLALRMAIDGALSPHIAAEVTQP